MFGFFVPLENISLIWRRDVTITSEGLQILTYARHSWSLSRERSLGCRSYWCHSYCDTEHPFIMDITSHLLRVLSSGTVTTCFYDLGLSRLGFGLPTFRLRGERHRRGEEVLKRHTYFYSFCYKLKTFSWACMKEGLRIYKCYQCQL